MVDLLLKKGARINEKMGKGQTVLYYGLKKINPEVLQTLFEWGADINILDYTRKSLFSNFYDKECWRVIAKHLAKLKFDNKFICNANLACMREKELSKPIDRCMKELQSMKDHLVFNNISLYEILKMPIPRKRMISLSKNEDFVAAFESNWDRQSFKYYGHDLDMIFREAVEKKNMLESEMKKIYESGLNIKFRLPSKIIEEIALKIVLL